MSGMKVGTAIGLSLLVACSSQSSLGSRPTPAPQAGSRALALDAGLASETPGDPPDGVLVRVDPNPCGGMPCPSRDVEMARVPDHDGFSVEEGDCNDFSDAVNP